MKILKILCYIGLHDDPVMRLSYHVRCGRMKTDELFKMWSEESRQCYRCGKEMKPS